MNEFITTLASKAGIDTGKASSGVGALLSTLQSFVPADTYNRVAAAIPDAGSMLTQFQSTATMAAPGTGSALSGLASAFLGSSSEIVSALLARLSQAGFSNDMIKNFLPVAAGAFRERVPSDVLQQVNKSIPGFTAALDMAGRSGIAGKLGGFFS